MENILAKLAQHSAGLLRSNDSVVSPTRTAYNRSKQTYERIDAVSANKALFYELFGEEAPSWWGNFEPVRR